jgi:hypothetical protein
MKRRLPPRSVIAFEQVLISNKVSNGVRLRSSITLSGNDWPVASDSKATPSARLFSSFGTGKLRVRWGTSNPRLMGRGGGDCARDFGLNRAKGRWLSFSFPFCVASMNWVAVGDTVGDITSNLPSRRDWSQEGLGLLGVSFTSGFLRAKTFVKNEGMSCFPRLQDLDSVSSL